MPEAQDVDDVLSDVDSIDDLLAAFEDQNFSCVWQDGHTHGATALRPHGRAQLMFCGVDQIAYILLAALWFAMLAPVVIDLMEIVQR